MSDNTPLLRRGNVVLRADPSRVIAKLFLPGQELVAHGISRADAVIQRALALTEAEVGVTLARVVQQFSQRHHDLEELFAEHFRLISHHVPGADSLSESRRQLIGAYCTQEFSVEAAALFNPSIVPHPDQRGLAPGELRFVMSVRAVGEGHISSIEFRTGVLTSDTVVVDDPGSRLTTGRAYPSSMSRDFLRGALSDRPDRATADPVLRGLRAHFTVNRLEQALASVQQDRLMGSSSDPIIERIREISAGHYSLTFRPDRPISERVIYPTSAAERQGMEDARFTRMVENDGSRIYYGTYTAFDGARISPRLIQTKDFQTFDVSQMIGPAAKDKGMALFPRRVGGRYQALSRWDRETIGVASSPDARSWGDPVAVWRPGPPWELIQLGNCGSPIETDAGWLVLTHGVGPMRTYEISAILLDLEDPTRLIGALHEPLLTPDADERDGYVPNVVYSCGALVHDGTLIVPYGCSDSSIRFAFGDVAELLARMVSVSAATRQPASAG